ncbi:MAG: PrsW family intramembrane metalloprotease [Armatimonadetes bacterium]|nr:PrsW family intramembrane metalloprotease [Armatimonadota bacterium]
MSRQDLNTAGCLLSVLGIVTLLTGVAAAGLSVGRVALGDLPPVLAILLAGVCLPAGVLLLLRGAGLDAERIGDLGTRLEDEPALKGALAEGEPEAAGTWIEDEPALGGGLRGMGVEEEAEHSVWDEPALRAAAVEAPAGEVTYSRLYRERARTTGAGKSVAVTLLVALVGGPLAVLGAFWAGGGALSLIVFGPAAEEVLKVATVSYVVETRPYLFRTSVQVLLGVAAAGLAFSVIENLIYLNIYIRDPSPQIVAWRWQFATTLHVAATLVAGIGLVRVWQRSRVRFERPRLADGLGWLVAAIVLHGGYNAFVTVYEIGWRPF